MRSAAQRDGGVRDDDGCVVRRGVQRQYDVPARELHAALRPLGGQEIAVARKTRRADGYAIENGEYRIGLRSAAAPVYTNEGQARYAVGVIGMFRSVRSEEFTAAIEEVRAAAAMISAALGCRMPESAV